MFLGQYRHTMDDKGRLTIPARFREVLMAEGAFVTRGLDQNLLVLPSSTYQAISQNLGQMNVLDANTRTLHRLLYSSSYQVEFDKAGRILLPQQLRQEAGLQGEIVIVGMGGYFEIWTPDQWGKQAEKLAEAQTDPQHFSALNLVAG